MFRVDSWRCREDGRGRTSTIRPVWTPGDPMGSITRTRLNDLNTPNAKLSTSDTSKQLVGRVCMFVVAFEVCAFTNMIVLISLKCPSIIPL